MAVDEAPHGKSPTRQSWYGYGALRGILMKVNKKAGPNDPALIIDK